MTTTMARSSTYEPSSPLAWPASMCFSTASHAAAATPPRLLILRGEASDADERRLRSLLAIAGLAAVTLTAEDADGIGAARPDWVIGCGIDALPAGTEVGGFIKAEELMAAPDRIAALSRLVEAAGGGS